MYIPLEVLELIIEAISVEEYKSVCLVSRRFYRCWLDVIRRRMGKLVESFGLPRHVINMCNIYNIYIAGAAPLYAVTGEIIPNIDLDFYVSSKEHQNSIVSAITSYGYTPSTEEYFDYRDLSKRTVVTLYNHTQRINIIRLEYSSTVPIHIIRTSFSTHIMNWYHQGRLYIHSPYHVSRRLMEYNTYCGHAQDKRDVEVLISKYKAHGYIFEKWEALRTAIKHLVNLYKTGNPDDYISLEYMCRIISIRDNEWPVTEIYRLICLESGAQGEIIGNHIIFRGMSCISHVRDIREVALLNIGCLSSATITLGTDHNIVFWGAPSDYSVYDLYKITQVTITHTSMRSSGGLLNLGGVDASF